MKAILLICALALALAEEEDFDIQSCLERPQVDWCFPDSHIYYYDHETGSCKTMFRCASYSNKNQFESEEDCVNKCGNTSTMFDTLNCLRAPRSGWCRADFELYYWDFKDRSCKTFIYGGCDGNDNSFGTEEECMQKCGDAPIYESECDLPLELGDCIQDVTRYYFDVKTRRCQTFIYGGCGGNDNNFHTKEECIQRCGA